MLEILETQDLISDIANAVCGKRIVNVLTQPSQQGLIWFYDDRQSYHKLLIGKTVLKIICFRGIVQIKAGNVNIILSDGIELKLHGKDEKSPEEYQLLIEFDDSSKLSASVKTYGAIWCYKEGKIINPYFGNYAPEM